MTKTSQLKDGEVDEAPSNSNPIEFETRKTKSYESLKRKLSEKELMNIGSVNLMIDEIERMNLELGELRLLRENFHSKDKSHAILSEKLAAYKLAELSYNISISLGALLIGSAKSLWNIEYFGIIALIGGLALWASGTAMKFGRMFVK